MIDVIVTRQPDDPTHYRHMIAMCPSATLIEVPFAESVMAARKRLVEIGTADYICWFDPDDKLYSYALPQMVQELKKNPNPVGVLTLSDYQFSDGKRHSIRVGDFLKKPVDGHWFRILRRDWLAKNLHLLEHPVPEWPLIAQAIEDGATFLNIKSYCWMIGNGVHKRITPQGVNDTRNVVRQILGDKYAKLVEQYRK